MFSFPLFFGPIDCILQGFHQLGGLRCCGGWVEVEREKPHQDLNRQDECKDQLWRQRISVRQLSFQSMTYNQCQYHMHKLDMNNSLNIVVCNQLPEHVTNLQSLALSSHLVSKIHSFYCLHCQFSPSHTATVSS